MIGKTASANFPLENQELSVVRSARSRGFSRCCVLVGPNNAGKSNILLALHRVLGYDWASVTRFRPDEDRFMHDPANDVEIVAFLDPPYQYQKTKALDKTAIHAVRFSLTRYKEKGRAGEPRLEQACLDKNEKVASTHVGQKDGGGRGCPSRSTRSPRDPRRIAADLHPGRPAAPRPAPGRPLFGASDTAG